MTHIGMFYAASCSCDKRSEVFYCAVVLLLTSSLYSLLLFIGHLYIPPSTEAVFEVLGIVESQVELNQANEADFTTQHTSNPVSYTHLDVYKRQIQR